LQLNDYKRIIDELYELGLVRVCLSGGEAFTKPCIWELIEYLWEKEIVFDVFTNGILLDTEKIARLVKYYPRVVGISIYSGVASEHDLITRVSGSWERSMNTIKLLSEYGVLMHLKCCVMRPNVRNYYKVADIAKEYGATPQFEISITDSVEGDMCASENLRLPPEMLEIVLRDDNVPLYVGKEAPNFGGQVKSMDRNPCGAGENSFCITPEGNVQICVSFPQSLGNLRVQTMSEIISGSPELKYWSSTTLADYEECGRYDYCAYCNLCPGINYSTHGSHLKAALSTCDIAKTRFNLAQKMMKSGYDPLSGKTLKECLSVLDNSIPSLKRVFAARLGGSESGKRINEVS
jgi:radical SAM protein with 4Fe4S-binding SPASM domain